MLPTVVGYSVGRNSSYIGLSRYSIVLGSVTLEAVAAVVPRSSVDRIWLEAIASVTHVGVLGSAAAVVSESLMDTE